jgi:ribosomal protein S12 methylthiotransferase accessory factor
MRRVGEFRNDPVGGGGSFRSFEDASHAAIGEGVERYCGNLIQTDRLRVASFETLAAEGSCAVDPETLVMFSDAQYSAPGFPFAPLERHRPVVWIDGYNMTTAERAWLPASLVYANWHPPNGASGAPVNGTFFPGIAAGTSFDNAVAAGLLEVIERHVTMVWWMNRLRMPEIRAIRDNGIPTLPQVCNGEASVIQLRNEFGVPVVAGVLLDPALQLLTVGFAARGDPKQACLKAWTEAVSLQEMSRDLLDPAGAFRAAVRAGRLAGSAVKPWRADRRYIDDYRTDMRDVIDMMCQVQFYLDPRAQALASPLLATTGDVELSSIEPVDPSATSLRHLVEARGFEVFVADITTKDVAVAGYSVVRVLVPGLVPNAVAAFPFLGREAVQKAAVASGARETPLEEWELNYLPLPHA